MSKIQNHSGSKYMRTITDCTDREVQAIVDVYAVLRAFNVTCPARQHAIKKLLCSGLRGKGPAVQDLKETQDAVARAIEFAEQELEENPPVPSIPVPDDPEVRKPDMAPKGIKCQCCDNRADTDKPDFAVMKLNGWEKCPGGWCCPDCKDDDEDDLE